MQYLCLKKLHAGCLGVEVAMRQWTHLYPSSISSSTTSSLGVPSTASSVPSAAASFIASITGLSAPWRDSAQSTCLVTTASQTASSPEADRAWLGSTFLGLPPTAEIVPTWWRFAQSCISTNSLLCFCILFCGLCRRHSVLSSVFGMLHWAPSGTRHNWSSGRCRDNEKASTSWSASAYLVLFLCLSNDRLCGGLHLRQGTALKNSMSAHAKQPDIGSSWEHQRILSCSIDHGYE